MENWTKEVQMVDKDLLLPLAFCQKIFGGQDGTDEIDYSQALAATQIYIEDGGEKYTFDEFLDLIIWDGHVEIPEGFDQIKKQFQSQPNPFIEKFGH